MILEKYSQPLSIIKAFALWYMKAGAISTRPSNKCLANNKCVSNKKIKIMNEYRNRATNKKNQRRQNGKQIFLFASAHSAFWFYSLPLTLSLSHWIISSITFLFLSSRDISKAKHISTIKKCYFTIKRWW